MVERLDDEGMLPAIYFIFSRTGCNQAVEACVAAGMHLTDPEERQEIRRIAEARARRTSTNDDLAVLGYRDVAGRPRGGLRRPPRRHGPP